MLLITCKEQVIYLFCLEHKVKKKVHRKELSTKIKKQIEGGVKATTIFKLKCVPTTRATWTSKSLMVVLG